MYLKQFIRTCIDRQAIAHKQAFEVPNPHIHTLLIGGGNLDSQHLPCPDIFYRDYFFLARQQFTARRVWKVLRGVYRIETGLRWRIGCYGRQIFCKRFISARLTCRRFAGAWLTASLVRACGSIACSTGDIAKTGPAICIRAFINGGTGHSRQYEKHKHDG